MFVLALTLACSGPPASTAPEVPGLLGDGWVQALVLDPTGFSAVVERDGRAGWVALHDSDWASAANILPTGLPAARAELELALVDEDLARLSATAWPMLLARWRQSDSTIDASLLPLLSAMARADVGVVDPAAIEGDARAWVDALANPSADTLAALPKLADDAARTCLSAHIALRAGVDDVLPDGCLGGTPFGGDGAPTLYDPLVAGSQARLHRHRAEQLAGGPLGPALQQGGLDALLFSSWWSRDDLDADLAADPGLSNPGASGPTLAALHLPDAGDDDGPQAARERVRALTVALDGWVEALRGASGDDGLALLDDLQLVQALRSRILIAWARAALHADRPHQATAYLQLAHDLESAGEVGPTNPPALFVLQAEALLRTGRTRQALDALSVLGDDLPGLSGAVETIGDLAVLEGMGRHGDSKEN